MALLSGLLPLGCGPAASDPSVPPVPGVPALEAGATPVTTSDAGPADASAGPGASAAGDATAAIDAGATVDAAAVVDAAARVDAGNPRDAGAADSSSALDGGSSRWLGLPRTDSFGSPIDVGLLILGHSTSAQGDYPAKLAQALGADALDGRNYVPIRTITGGDGGFLWTQLRFAPNDPHYAHVGASQANVQYCTDRSNVRWSCRRMRLDMALTGTVSAPSECAPRAAACDAPVVTCVWHENGQRFERANTSAHECLGHMDVRIALVQDTTNRSWPVDDFDGDGVVRNADYWPSSTIPAAATSCPGGGGIVNGFVDWSCDGRLDNRDAPALVYASWLERLANDLLARSIDHVFITQKPVEMGNCARHYRGEQCAPHNTRTPTPSRPFDHYYLPTVYWEGESVRTLLARANLDPRIHGATPFDVRAMWAASAACYTRGMGVSDWAIPASNPRPASIAADDGEIDSGAGVDAESVGCMRSDHVHHTEAGGWSMADVWYRGLRNYF